MEEDGVDSRPSPSAEDVVSGAGVDDTRVRDCTFVILDTGRIVVTDDTRSLPAEGPSSSRGDPDGERVGSDGNICLEEDHPGCTLSIPGNG